MTPKTLATLSKFNLRCHHRVRIPILICCWMTDVSMLLLHNWLTVDQCAVYWACIHMHAQPAPCQPFSSSHTSSAVCAQLSVISMSSAVDSKHTPTPRHPPRAVSTWHQHTHTHTHAWGLLPVYGPRIPFISDRIWIIGIWRDYYRRISSVLSASQALFCETTARHVRVADTHISHSLTHYSCSETG